MKHFRNTLLAAGTSALLMIGSGVIAGEGRVVDESVEAMSEGHVRFKIIDGDVSFKSWNKQLVKITGRLGHEDDELILKNDGKDTTIKVESKGHRHYNKKGYNYGGSNAKLEVYMPANSHLFAQSTSGDFKIDGMQGGIKAKNVSGDIEISNSTKSIKAYSSSGDIVLDECSGEFHVETVSGELEANVQADRFEASTISGDIDAKVGKTERLVLSSVSGDMDVVLELADEASLEASTVSGDIDLMFDQDTLDAHFMITTGPGGDISNRLSNDKPETSWIHSEMLEFKLASGESHIELETVSGSIDLQKR